ncbi:hypothetical protein FOZ63_031242 [Perkinsus olseni]|uniref:Uncharacterized protein n=1 Tax=Perkinsus olseni TaxID=32597 RepID=A0A7J6QSL1_PEROL|nr:hypothetical protein FOZ63_031242 [Perkinsus olseni]KAF4743221.1 hypothetical protein FOZ62_015711 [Perkinsus olseni]
MFFIHRVANAVTMMYNESDELTVCHFIRPKERAKILEGLADQSDQAEADDVQESSEPAPEQREVLVMGEGRVLATSPSPVSVGGGVVQPSSPARDEDAQRTLSAIESSSAALEERGSPSRPASRSSSPVRGYHSTPPSSSADDTSEVGFTFEEYEREAENVLKGIFSTAEKIINGEEGSFGEGLDEALLPVVKEIEAL